MSGIVVGQLILWLIVALIVIVVAVYIVNWLYHRSSKEVSFVRTGFLGERVGINGGAFVLAFTHAFTPVEAGRGHRPRSQAHRYQSRFLCAGAGNPRGGFDRGDDTGPPNAGTRTA